MSRDSALLNAWRSGDRQAGAIFVERHFADVWRFFRRRAPGYEDELTQQTFESCLAGATDYRGDGTARAFLFGIANNRLLQHFSERRRAAVELDRDLEAQRTSPTQAQIDRERRKILVRAMQELPTDLQILLDLRYWQELSTREIAAVLELNDSTVRGRLKRARDQLVEVLSRMDIGAAVRDSTITHLRAVLR